MQTKKCPFCGRELFIEANFCPYCMNKLNKESVIDFSDDVDNMIKRKRHIIGIAFIVIICIVMVSINFIHLYSNYKNENNVQASDDGEMLGENIAASTENQVTKASSGSNTTQPLETNPTTEVKTKIPTADNNLQAITQKPSLDNIPKSQEPYKITMQPTEQSITSGEPVTNITVPPTAKVTAPIMQTQKPEEKPTSQITNSILLSKTEIFNALSSMISDEFGKCSIENVQYGGDDSSVYYNFSVNGIYVKTSEIGQHTINKLDIVFESDNYESIYSDVSFKDMYRLTLAIVKAFEGDKDLEKYMKEQFISINEMSDFSEEVEADPQVTLNKDISQSSIGSKISFSAMMTPGISEKNEEYTSFVDAPKERWQKVMKTSIRF